MVTQTKRQIFNIYVDETSKNDTYFGVGAILCEDKAATFLEGWMHERIAANKQPFEKEIHWKDFKKSNDLVNLYTEVGTSLIGFAINAPRRLSYRSILAESRRIQRDKRAGETLDDVIAKFVFTLVFEAAVRVGSTVDYHVYIDTVDGDERSNVATLCALNNKYKSKFRLEEGPFKSVEYVRSETNRLIQATDLLTGVIAYEMNGRHLVPGAALHKKQVFEAMLAKSRFRTFTEPTKHYPPQFQIRHFDFARSTFTLLKSVEVPQLDRPPPLPRLVNRPLPGYLPPRLSLFLVSAWQRSSIRRPL